MERNTLMFDRKTLRKEIVDAIKEVFNTDEWVKTFDGNELKIINRRERVSDKFPVVSIVIKDDHPFVNGKTSQQHTQYTEFNLLIEIYNKDSKAKKIDRETLSEDIGDAIIYCLQTKFGYMHTYNDTNPNEDVSVARRTILYTQIINNETRATFIR